MEEHCFTFETTINTSECADINSGSYALNKYGPQALEFFAEVLRASGMSVELEFTNATQRRAKIKIGHDGIGATKRARTRNAGRPRARHDGSVTLDWLESHSVEEGMQALGNVSRRTYYRRLAEMRKGRESA